MAFLGRRQPFKPIILRGLATSSADVTVALTGVSAAGSVGSVTPSTTVTASGVQGSGQVGDVSGGQPISGVFATGSVGTVVPNITVALTGVQATGSVGTVTVSGTGDVTIAITGVQATGSVGSVTVSGGDNLIDTHDGGEKRRKAHQKQKKKEEREDRERQEKRRRQIIEAFEQVIEGKVSRETNIEQVIAPAAEYAVQTPEIARKTDFDFEKWLDNLTNVERILDDYLEADDEEVLVLL